MVEPKPGSGCDPKPAAGNKGTTIIVCLFYKDHDSHY